MWSPDSWKSRPSHQFEYPDAARLESAVAKLSSLPPLVTSWEVERLKGLIAGAARGEGFVLQGGDCAERMSECASEPIAGRLKILLQMSLVLFHATGRPITRVGRFAGQYGKPRSSATETRGAVTLPSYFGDLVNREAFEETARRPDPALMIEGYFHSAATLNFIRSLVDRGFADLHHPENWDLGLLRKAGLPEEFRARYRAICDQVVTGLASAEARGEAKGVESARAEFFTSHEGLNLHFESALTRRVPRRSGWYDLSAHMPWIGDRTRDVDGGHVEFFRGIANPVGVKVGPRAKAEDVLGLCERLNPQREAGKLALISRMGAEKVGSALPPLVEALAREGWGAPAVMWICDPMHGNTVLAGAKKTRRFGDVLGELETCWEVHRGLGGRLGGVHIEVTHEDVTECLGGASGVREGDLDLRYTSACDPRLNYDQAMELAFMLSERIRGEAGPGEAPR